MRFRRSNRLVRRIELAAVDGIRAGGTDCAGSHVDDLALCACCAHAHHAFGGCALACKDVSRAVEPDTGFGGGCTVGAGVAQHHAVGLRGGDRVAQYKGVVLSNGVVVTHRIRIAAHDDVGVSKRTTAVARDIVAHTHADRADARGNGPRANGNGAGFAGLGTVADAHCAAGGDALARIGAHGHVIAAADASAGIQTAGVVVVARDVLPSKNTECRVGDT